MAELSVLRGLEHIPKFLLTFLNRWQSDYLFYYSKHTLDYQKSIIVLLRLLLKMPRLSPVLAYSGLNWLCCVARNTFRTFFEWQSLYFLTIKYQKILPENWPRIGKIGQIFLAQNRPIWKFYYAKLIWGT